VERCIDNIVMCIKDQQPFCRKHALRAFEVLIADKKMRGSMEEFQAIALKYMPILVDVIRDNDNVQVVVQALKIIRMFKLKNLAETYNGTLEEDSFYVNQIIEPHSKILTNLLTTRKFSFSKDIRVELLILLGETDHLRSFISAYKPILNSDQISTLVEFAEAIQTLGPRILQYIPPLIMNIQSPSSPLVRHFVRLMQKYTKTMTVETCEKLFQTHTVSNLLKHRDPTVRRIAVQIMGKKCFVNPRNLWSLIEMWTDKNAKVKKEVMDVLGDFGKVHKDQISQIMGTSLIEDINSIIVWRNLSFAWQCLIVKPHNRENAEESSNSAEDMVEKATESSTSDSGGDREKL